jgi:hypothetical protein
MKLTLCGSTRFKNRFVDANKRLTAAGHVVYSVAFHGHAEGAEPDPATKETLDLVHLRKIQESDAVVLITNHAQYIGDSTRRELRWAAILGKLEFSWVFSDHRRQLLKDRAPVPSIYFDLDEEVGHVG